MQLELVAGFGAVVLVILQREAGARLEARMVLVPFDDRRLELLKAEVPPRLVLVPQVFAVPSAQLDGLCELVEQAPSTLGIDLQGRDQVHEAALVCLSIDDPLDG